MREVVLARRVFNAYRKRIDELPVDLVTICRALRFVAVRSTKLPGFDGCHLRFDTSGRTLILLNSNMCHCRKRFTLAHEIGHILLGHLPAQLQGGSIVEARHAWQEAEANRFASELLMPLPALKKFGMLTVEGIAQVFDVSPAAARIKARQLGWEDETARKYGKAQVEADLDRMFGPRRAAAP